MTDNTTNPNTDMVWPDNVVMPAGQYQGCSIASVPLRRLIWWLSQNGIRVKHPKVCAAILALLGKRIADGTATKELLDDAGRDLPSGYDLV